MDTEYEARLLRMIDDFLRARPNFEDFRAFRPLFRDSYGQPQAAATRVLKDRFPNPSFDDLIKGGYGDEVRRIADDLLPRERRRFFELVLDRASFTNKAEIDPDMRRDGWGTLDEFVEFLRRE